MPVGTLRAGAISLLAAAAFVGTRVAPAAAPGYEIQVGVIESDNIERLPSGGTDETIGVVDLGFSWHDKRPWLDADVDADVSHLNYFQHTYSDEFIGNFIGAVKISLVPDLLTWNVADDFGQVPLQPLAPINPANREILNYVSTGLSLSLPLGQTNQLGAIGQYGKVDYQTSPLDSTIATGRLTLLHEFSPATSISLNAKEESIHFVNDQVNPDSDIQEGFARFDAKGSRTVLGVDLGFSRVQTQVPGGSGHAPLVRLSLSRDVSGSSTIGAAFGHDYANAADSFVLVQSVGGATANTLPVAPAGAPALEDYATLAWNFKRARTELTLSGSYFHDHYQTDAALNSDRTMVEALASRQMTPTVKVTLTEYLVRWQYTSTAQDATTTDTDLALNWRLGKSLSLSLAYDLAKGSSNVPTYVYKENRVWLSIGYGRAAEVPPGPAPVRLPGIQQ